MEFESSHLEKVAAAANGGSILSDADRNAERGGAAAESMANKKSSRRIRLFGAGLMLLTAPVLGIGLWLRPRSAGLGTHTELGFPPCPFYRRYDIPCPTCGYTTAVSHVAHGQWIAAIVTQPAGATIGFLVLSAFILGTVGLLSGRWYGPSLFWLGWRLERIIIVATAIFIGAWVYKVLVASAWFAHHW